MFAARSVARLSARARSFATESTKGKYVPKSDMKAFFGDPATIPIMVMVTFSSVLGLFYGFKYLVVCPDAHIGSRKGAFRGKDRNVPLFPSEH